MGDELKRNVRTRPRYVVAVRVGRAVTSLRHPAKTAAGFWAAGAVAAASMVFGKEVTPEGRVTLVVVICLCLIGAAAYFFAGERIPRWGLHIGTVSALGIISVGAALEPGGSTILAVLYIWVIVYAALFFSPLATAVYVTAIAAAYAGVLDVGPAVDNRLLAWMAIFGTGAVTAAVVSGLVSLLRIDGRKDPLTGLANRRSWDERLDEELARAKRAATVFSVAMIDLDEFKMVNDTHGHAAGDQLLRQLATTWQGMVREGGDFLARLGGDEFALLTPGIDEAGILRLTDRFNAAAPDGVTFSLGTATWDGTGTAGDLMRRADQAMYQKKVEHRTPTSRRRSVRGQRDDDLSRSGHSDGAHARVGRGTHGDRPTLRHL
ncbi:MAG: GGDEF domain-containing protein [Actinomycetota bacterium]|jgi:diguanylate cyclase (GGDEF)-like protein|nr:GGDEF domain-containing protein [Actinomycetota bacterium]MDA8077222.1 GGDEF domain-containing protein [Actinomycetota bacterium]